MCCGQDSKADGCQIGKHVYDGDDYEINVPLKGYIQTIQTASSIDINNVNVYALDCEMVN